MESSGVHMDYGGDRKVLGQRYSVLPALTSEGIISLDIFQGSVYKEKFIQFVNDQLVKL